jgi:protein-glutamine gamma-glutamyltransferase
MEKKRPQLNLTELYQLKWVLGGVLALLSAWTVFYMEIEAALWLVLITVTVPVVVRWPVLTLYVPRWAHQLAFPLFVALFAGDYYFNREPLPAMIRLALMLVFYRVLTARRRRDDLQLIVLGLFLVVVAGVLSVSILFALQIVVFTGCTLAFLMVINLIDSGESGQAQAAFSTKSPPAWMRIEFMRLARRLHEATNWRVALLATGLFGGVVTLSALLFFALPRFEFSNRFFLDNLVKGKSQTGFSESVRFNDVINIQQDTSVALRVEVSDTRAIPADPYWRMLVLDDYKEGVFSVSDGLRAQMQIQRTKVPRISGTSRPRLGDATWTFYLEPGTSRYLPLLGSFYQIQFNGGPQDFAINDELRMLRLEKNPSKMFAYRVEGMRYDGELGPLELKPHRDTPPKISEAPEDYGPAGLGPPAPPTFLGIDLPAEQLAQVSAWARALAAPEDDAKAFAAKAAGWLAERHGYSLQINIGAEDGDPLVRWMASSQPGHCELFAGAFTLLARSAGYPTRMVTGFHGGTWNAASNHLSIRNSDAHAWCEIYDRKSATWSRVDPTPGAPLPGSIARNEKIEVTLERIRDTSWSAKVDGLRMFWYRRIVDFDHNSQAELARDAKSAIQRYAAAFKAEITRRLAWLKDWLNRPWDLARLGAWVVVVATAFGIVLGWRRHGRIVWLRWRSGMTRRGVDPVRKEAGRWLRRLSQHPDAVDVVARQRVKAELERLRYGPRHNWPNPQGAFRRAKEACRK